MAPTPGGVAEWSCSGLQSRVRRFDSDPRLHPESLAIIDLDVRVDPGDRYPYVINPRLPTVAAENMFLSDNSIEVVVTRLQANAEEVRAADAVLSDIERKRAGSFVFDRDRIRFIVARARLRQLLAARLGIRPAEVELTYGENGKPALSRYFAGSDLHFNLSHSNDVAAFAFASGRMVGIDVEAIRAMEDAEAIAARFFSQFENKAYLRLRPADKQLGFFNCWTRKEAFVKGLGAGLSYPLDHFDVSLAPDEPAAILRVEDKSGNECGWRLDAFCPAEGYVAAVVVQDA